MDKSLLLPTQEHLFEPSAEAGAVWVASSVTVDSGVKVSGYHDAAKKYSAIKQRGGQDASKMKTPTK